MNSSKVSGVYHRRLKVSIRDVQHHRRLCNYLKLYFRRYRSSFNFAPEIYKILDFCPSLSFVPCFMLSYTLCRINELDQISVMLLKSYSEIKIVSSKSDHTRFIPCFNKYKLNTLLAVPDSTKIMIVSYDSLKSTINSCKSYFKIDLPPDILSSTHIFRHLQSSWLYANGVPIDDISYKLGHIMNKTTFKYIHDIYKLK